jgi:hypothetical protein
LSDACAPHRCMRRRPTPRARPAARRGARAGLRRRATERAARRSLLPPGAAPADHATRNTQRTTRNVRPAAACSRLLGVVESTFRAGCGIALGYIGAAPVSTMAHCASAPSGPRNTHTGTLSAHADTPRTRAGFSEHSRGERRPCRTPRRLRPVRPAARLASACGPAPRCRSSRAGGYPPQTRSAPSARGPSSSRSRAA